MEGTVNVLITGAAGNLGTLLARHLLDRSDVALRLMFHHRPLPADLSGAPRVETVRADLADPASLPAAIAGVDQIIHFAGVLFRAGPERFLPVTNTIYFRNLVAAALTRGVRKIILVSFPHVEGPTSFERPAAGRLDVEPVSVHARTRLEEERHLFEVVPQPVSLRVGMVYGRGILMIDAARWLARRRLLGIWRESTPIHLISKIDFCDACTAALLQPSTRGIYHLGDDDRLSLQDFLDRACGHWRLPRPWRMPLGWIYAAARICEFYSRITGGPAPLTRDFIDIGRVPYYGDTTRMKAELLPRLRYPDLTSGLATL